MSAIKKAPAGNRSSSAPQSGGGCPLTAALAAIGGKWKLIIVYWLGKVPKHFVALVGQRKFPLTTDAGVTEHIWAYVHHYADGIFNVSLANTPHFTEGTPSERDATSRNLR